MEFIDNAASVASKVADPLLLGELQGALNCIRRLVIDKRETAAKENEALTRRNVKLKELADGLVAQVRELTAAKEQVEANAAAKELYAFLDVMGANMDADEKQSKLQGSLDQSLGKMKTYMKKKEQAETQLGKLSFNNEQLDHATFTIDRLRERICELEKELEEEKMTSRSLHEEVQREIEEGRALREELKRRDERMARYETAMALLFVGQFSFAIAARVAQIVAAETAGVEVRAAKPAFKDVLPLEEYYKRPAERAILERHNVTEEIVELLTDFKQRRGPVAHPPAIFLGRDIEDFGDILFGGRNSVDPRKALLYASAECLSSLNAVCGYRSTEMTS